MKKILSIVSAICMMTMAAANLTSCTNAADEGKKTEVEQSVEKYLEGTWGNISAESIVFNGNTVVFNNNDRKEYTTCAYTVDKSKTTADSYVLNLSMNGKQVGWMQCSLDRSDNTMYTTFSDYDMNREFMTWWGKRIR